MPDFCGEPWECSCPRREFGLACDGLCKCKCDDCEDAHRARLEQWAEQDRYEPEEEYP